MADDAGALLVRSGLVSSSALDAARAKVADVGGTIGEQLVAEGAVDDDQLTNFYKQRLLVPQVNPNTLARLPAKVVAVIPSEMAIELRAIPVSLDQDNNLTIAMSDPSDRHAVDEISFFTGAYVVRAVATQMQIAWCLAHYYGHVTNLGERLIEPSDAQRRPRSDSKPPLPRTRGEIPDKTVRDTEPLTAVSEDSGPIVEIDEIGIEEEAQITIEADEDDDDGAITIEAEVAGRYEPVLEVEVEQSKPVPKRRRPVSQADPPELAARAGEVQLATGAPIRRIDFEEPSIFVADNLAEENSRIVRQASGEVPGREHLDRPPSQADEASIFIELGNLDSAAIVYDELHEEESRAVSVVRHVREAEIDDDDFVVLPPKRSPVRRDRRTKLGIGIVKVHTQSGVPTEIDNEPTEASTYDPTRLDADSTPTSEMSAVELDEAIPERRRKRSVPDDDDEWGPPGTTIPPPLLGAIPGAITPPSGIIPISDIDSAPLMVAPPTPPEPGTRAKSSSEATISRALESATARVLELIHTLGHTTDRDQIIAVMIAHLAESHRRAGFFAMRSSSLSLFAIIPRIPVMPTATLRLDRPSTLQDVVDTRLPYRGPMLDDASRAFLTSTLGVCPPEILLVPITVKERVVGVLFGDQRIRHTFDDQLALAARAAGMALESLLKTRRR